jgi:predicted tellurium resistance membrane protein TerC
MLDFSFALTPELIIAFLTLFVLEVVLGIDNVIFVSILAGKLPLDQQSKARVLGLTAAMITRIGLLFVASWIISLTQNLFVIFGLGFSGRELILIVGGLFLIYKAVREIHEKLEGADSETGGAGKTAAFGAVVAQILLLDVVFSLDSVITAVGMVDNLVIIILAIVLSFALMLFTSKYVFAFVNQHPTVKMLALAFLVLIGATLVADGFNVHIDKALIYGPIAFAIVVEALNLTFKARQEKRARKSDAHVAVATAPANGVIPAASQSERFTGRNVGGDRFK